MQYHRQCFSCGKGFRVDQPHQVVQAFTGRDHRGEQQVQSMFLHQECAAKLGAWLQTATPQQVELMPTLDSEAVEVARAWMQAHVTERNGNETVSGQAHALACAASRSLGLPLREEGREGHPHRQLFTLAMNAVEADIYPAHTM